MFVSSNNASKLPLHFSLMFQISHLAWFLLLFCWAWILFLKLHASENHCTLQSEKQEFILCIVYTFKTSVTVWNKKVLCHYYIFQPNTSNMPSLLLYNFLPKSAAFFSKVTMIDSNIAKSESWVFIMASNSWRRRWISLSLTSIWCLRLDSSDCNASFFFPEFSTAVIYIKQKINCWN